MDWYSRKVLSWALSNTLDTDFCVAALEAALRRYGTPMIFNTDQGSQFTNEKFTGALERNGVRISMDGRGRFHDNLFIERLWGTVKHQCLHLTESENGLELRTALQGWFRTVKRRKTSSSPESQNP